MCQFIETIRVADGVFMNLKYHQKRMDDTMMYLGGKKISLESFLHDQHVLDEFHKTDNGDVFRFSNEISGTTKNVLKVRVVYDKEGIKEVSVAPYTVRSICSIKLVTCNSIDYSYKSVDRSKINELKEGAGDADEIIIVKNNLLTDTSYSNIALYDGVKWYTPKHPLLRGTMLQSLIDKGMLIERDIKAKDYFLYQKIALINAMMPLGTCEVLIKGPSEGIG